MLHLQPPPNLPNLANSPKTFPARVQQLAPALRHLPKASQRRPQLPQLLLIYSHVVDRRSSLAMRNFICSQSVWLLSISSRPSPPWHSLHRAIIVLGPFLPRTRAPLIVLPQAQAQAQAPVRDCTAQLLCRRATRRGDCQTQWLRIRCDTGKAHKLARGLTEPR